MDYNKIEKTFLLYKDSNTIKDVDPVTDREPLVEYKAFLVRETIAKKLYKVEKWLKRKNKDFEIVMLDGHRPMEIQKAKFKETYERISPSMPNASEMEILEECHKQIAVPEVSGHPTGGAVDLLIKGLDFGTGYCDWDAGKKLYYASPEISKTAKRNRKLLRKAMIKQGFLQYMAEWWHFSYGDKEWAFAKKRKKALYSQN